MTTQLLISLDPDQLGQLVRESVRAELAQYVPPAPSAPDLPEYLTRKDVSRLLRVSLVTVDDWADRGLLRRLRIGSRTRFASAEVLTFAQTPNAVKFKTKRSDRAEAGAKC